MLDAPTTEELSFEEAMESLESIVSSLEGERLPLERMVDSYEQGVKLLSVCRQRIQSARQRVDLITASLDGKSVTLTDFQPSSESAETPSVTPALPSGAPTSFPQEEAPRKAPRRKPEPPDDASGEIRLF